MQASEAPSLSSSTITALDVAREAGVSQSAVSRAFTPGASVSEKTRTRVLAAAEKLGYRPNPLARSLMHGRSGIVGVGVGNMENPFFVRTLELLATALDAAGLRLMLFPATRDHDAEPSLQEVLHYRIDALVLLSVNLSSNLADQCRKARVPVIHFNRTSADAGTSSIIGDNAAGARTIAAHLLAGGHRAMAYMAGTPDSSTNRQREEAFTAALLSAGLPVPIIEQGHFTPEGAMAATRRLLLRADRPDALFCANDTMALAAISVARHELGLDVGREISIVGYDDVPMAAWPGFALTTFSQPCEGMVARTVEMIEALRREPESHARHVAQGALVVRSSTRPVVARPR